MQRVRPERANRVVRSAVLFGAVAGLALSVSALGMPRLTTEPPRDPSPEAVEAAISHAQALSAAFEHAAAKVAPAVVNITATIGGDEQPQQLQPRNPRQPQPQMEDPFEEFRRRMFGDPFGRAQPGRRPVQQSMGSGIIVSPDGYILTNNHVIDDASRVEVTLADNTKYAAKVVGADPATDLAVLRIDGGEFTFATLGDSDAARVGEWVVAIGNPFGLNQTVTAGIISAKNRVQNGPGQLQDVQFQDFIQTDAAINRGNSGGPLVNLRGQVVGINSAIIGPANVGIGFAIPSNMAKGVMDSLIAGGKVDRGYLGVGLQDLTPELARTYEFQGSGVVVAEVSPDSPAAKAGMQTGDIVTRYEGRPVPTQNALRNAIAATPPGKKVEFEIVREGKKQVLSATLGSRADQAAAGGDADEFVSPVKGGLGITARTLTPELAEQVNARRNARGAVVTEIAPGSPAAGVLSPGDVIVQVMNQRVENAEDLRSALKAMDLRRGVRLVVQSQGRPRIVSVVVGR